MFSLALLVLALLVGWGVLHVKGFITKREYWIGWCAYMVGYAISSVTDAVMR